jgi:CheY-like chemotaxis protein
MFSNSPRPSPTARLSRAATPSKPLMEARILVVDDDPQVLRLLTRVLARAGALVQAKTSAAAALAALSEFDPDLLISDITMPGEDGLSLIRRIRATADPERGPLPAIALTGLIENTIREQATAAGFDVCVSKPVPMTDLIRIAARLALRGEG